MSQDKDEDANDDVDHDNTVDHPGDHLSRPRQENSATSTTKMDTINYQHVHQCKIKRPKR